MNRNRRTGPSLSGTVLFFFSIAAVVTASCLVCAYVSARKTATVTAAIMLALILFFTVLCTVLDYLRRILFVEKPVEKILEATDRIASGDFSARLEITHARKRYDGYDYIMENLNRMAEELSRTEMVHADFVSNVSHEMKTPLAIIRNYASSLKSDSLSEEQRKKYAETLVAASDRLNNLVVNILKLNKLENQVMRVETEKIRLDEMLAQAVLQYDELIEQKGLELECEFEELSVVSAPSYLEIVWNNLLSNAVKFTERGGKITVTLKEERRAAVVTVADTGCGISPETGAHIFDKFYQGDTSHAQEGNGLGLALVKKVIDVIGGEIGVESEKGKGSVFTVKLHTEVNHEG